MGFKYEIVCYDGGPKKYLKRKRYRRVFVEEPKEEQPKISQEIYGQIIAPLIAARRRLGLSQAQLAARLGTRQSAISRVESGYSLPSLKNLTKIAKALSLEIIVSVK